MLIEQFARPFKKAWTTNADTTSFASKIPTTTEPVNDGVVKLADELAGGSVPKEMLVLPYGLGADNDAASLRIIGWRHAGSGIPPGTLWIPSIIVEVACTFSAAVGITGAPVLNTERFADTITIVASRQRMITDGGAASRGTVEIFSPTNDLIGFLIIPLSGFEKIEFCWDQTTNTPTCNALIAGL